MKAGDLYAEPVRQCDRRVGADSENHKRTIRDKHLHVYFIDMVKIAREVATALDLQMRMQGIVLLGAF